MELQHRNLGGLNNTPPEIQFKEDCLTSSRKPPGLVAMGTCPSVGVSYHLQGLGAGHLGPGENWAGCAPGTSVLTVLLTLSHIPWCALSTYCAPGVCQQLDGEKGLLLWRHWLLRATCAPAPPPRRNPAGGTSRFSDS